MLGVSVGNIETNVGDFRNVLQDLLQPFKVRLTSSRTGSNISKALGVIAGKFSPLFRRVILVYCGENSMLKIILLVLS